MHRYLIILLSILFINCSEKKNTDWTNQIPTFDDFKTAGFCDTSFKSTNPDFENSNINSEYRKIVREQFKESNYYYNCKYLIASIQIAESDRELHIFNAYDGKFIKTLKHKYGAEFSKESSLIIVDGIEGGKLDELTQFWVMENGKMKKIK